MRIASAEGENPLEPTSAPGYAAFLAAEHPEPERIDESTFVLSIPLPSPAIVSSTLCYVFVGDDGGVHVVDPGWESDENIARLRAALNGWGLDRIDTVVATHLHPDHLGMAERVRNEFGARVVLSHRESDAVQARVFERDPDAVFDEWGVPAAGRPRLEQNPDFFAGWKDPDVLVADDDVLDLGRPVRVVLTPGHSQGGITLVDETRRRILTGDHVMPHINPGLGLGYVGESDPVGDYLEAAERLYEWDGFEVLPGHGYRFGRLGRRLDQHIGHHLRRTREVLAVLEREPDATVWQAASQLTWSAGWEGLTGYFLFSALAQTAMHVSFARDTARSARWLARE